WRRLADEHGGHTSSSVQQDERHRDWRLRGGRERRSLDDDGLVRSIGHRGERCQACGRQRVAERFQRHDHRLDSHPRQCGGRINETPAGSTDVFALTLGLNMPVIRMSGSTLTTTGVDADLVAVGGGVKTTGTALTATGSSTVNVKGSLLRLADVTSLATDPLVQLAASTVNQTATAKALIDVSGTTALTGQLLALDNSTVTATGTVLTVRGSLSDVPSRMTLTGPLFVATNNSGVSSASGVVIDHGAVLTGTSTSGLIRLVT